MSDAIVGHMTEKVIIPPVEELEIIDRKYTKKKPGNYQPYTIESGKWVPDFAKVGDGYLYHSTGLTHDERGYPDMSEECHVQLVNRLLDKINKNADDIIMLEERDIEDAEVVVVSFGITSRTVVPAIEKAKKKGIKVGYLRLITVWPFPEKRIRELYSRSNSKKIAGFVVPEINMGQIVLEVERCSGGNCKTISLPHPGGGLHDPENVVKAIQEVANARD